MNVIALVWDFDKTLVDGYMQDPIFERFGVDSTAFWGEVNALPERYRKKQGVDVNPDTIYLNHFIKYAHDGAFAGLSNESLKGFGKELRFYPGVPEIFDATRRVVEDEPSYKEYDIRVEHYIVSTGIKKVIEGSSSRKRSNAFGDASLSKMRMVVILLSVRLGIRLTTRPRQERYLKSIKVSELVIEMTSM